MDSILFAAIALFGLLTGLGHCIGMCGGIVVAYSSAKMTGVQSRRYQFLAHLFYGLGRTSAYGVFGVFAGLAGALFAFVPLLHTAALVLIGLLTVAVGVSLLGKMRFLSSVERGAISQTGWYKRAFAKLVRSPSFGSFYGIGLLNGLVPCGPVYAALVMALSAGSVQGSALAMLLYGAATIPALLVLGMTAGFMKQFHYRDLFNRLAAIAVMLFGFFTLFKAGQALLG